MDTRDGRIFDFPLEVDKNLSDKFMRIMSESEMVKDVNGNEHDPKNLIPMEIKPTKKQMSRKPPKVGRNDPCPCGSGKKFKNCHWTGNSAG